MIKEGDKVLVVVEATVVKVSNSHGTCYQVRLPKKDYNHDRLVFVEPDEIKEKE